MLGYQSTSTKGKDASFMMSRSFVPNVTIFYCGNLSFVHKHRNHVCADGTTGRTILDK